jgi:hypothetical protein
MALAPELDEVDAMCLQAWSKLTTCRPRGMGAAGPIPCTETLDWCAWKALDRDMTTLVLDVIELLEDRRAKLLRAQDNLNAPPPTPPAKGRRR